MTWRSTQVLCGAWNVRFLNLCAGYRSVPSLWKFTELNNYDMHRCEYMHTWQKHSFSTLQENLIKMMMHTHWKCLYMSLVAFASIFFRERCIFLLVKFKGMFWVNIFVFSLMLAYAHLHTFLEGGSCYIQLCFCVMFTSEETCSHCSTRHWAPWGLARVLFIMP